MNQTDKEIVVAALNKSHYEPEATGFTFEEIADIGGEGDGAATSKIFKVTKGNKTTLFRIDGYYSSWDSTDYGNAYEVEEYIKQVKDWKAI
jgi:hypothetical protein